MISIEHNPVTSSDIRAVFRLLAGIDGQQRSAEDAETWLVAARAGGWTRAQVAAATLALAAGFTGFRVQPGHMTEQIRRCLAQIRARWECPPPPRELAEDPAAEVRWRRRVAAEFKDRALLAIAAGDPLVDVPLLSTADSEPPRILPARPTDLREAVTS